MKILLKLTIDNVILQMGGNFNLTSPPGGAGSAPGAGTGGGVCVSPASPLAPSPHAPPAASPHPPPTSPFTAWPASPSLPRPSPGHHPSPRHHLDHKGKCVVISVSTMKLTDCELFCSQYPNLLKVLYVLVVASKINSSSSL